MLPSDFNTLTLSLQTLDPRPQGPLSPQSLACWPALQTSLTSPHRLSLYSVGSISLENLTTVTVEWHTECRVETEWRGGVQRGCEASTDCWWPTMASTREGWEGDYRGLCAPGARSRPSLEPGGHGQCCHK